MAVVLGLALLLSMGLNALVVHLYIRDARATGGDERALIRRLAESAFLPGDVEPRSHVRVVGEGESPIAAASISSDPGLVEYADPTDAALPDPLSPLIAYGQVSGDMPWQPDFDLIAEQRGME